MVTRWFTADQHFGHANIIKYCNRPFDSVDEMNETLVSRWNQVVAPDDTVYHLGDIAMGDKAERLEYISLLNGHIILYPGNHDSCWEGWGKYSPAKEQLYLDAGIGAIAQGTDYMDIGDYMVALNHFPYYGDSHDEDRFNWYRPHDESNWLIHGHIHDQWKVRQKMINVGVDVWDFYPVAEETIIDTIKGAP